MMADLAAHYHPACRRLRANQANQQPALLLSESAERQLFARAAQAVTTPRARGQARAFLFPMVFVAARLVSRFARAGVWDSDFAAQHASAQIAMREAVPLVQGMAVAGPLVAARAAGSRRLHKKDLALEWAAHSDFEHRLMRAVVPPLFVVLAAAHRFLHPWSAQRHHLKGSWPVLCSALSRVADGKQDLLPP